MPVNIGPKIGIEGEAEYRRQIQNIIQQTKTLKSEMQATSSAWDKDTSAQKKNAEQRKILSQQVQTQKERVAELQKMLEQSEAKYGENATQTLKWKQAVNEATAELNRLEGELKNIPNHMQEFGQSMQTAGEKIKGVGDALMPISAAASAGLGVAIKTAADFDAQMSKVQAISGATGEEFQMLRSKAREMGAETKFSASEAGAAMEYMAMAGWKAGDMVGGIEGIMHLAAASGTDLATTSDIVTDALTAFGLTAQDSGHFADVLAAASSNANTNVEMMGETFKYAAPLAGALGYNIEDMAVATGLMANAGIKGSQSGTALRGWLTRLAKPTKESSAAMEDLGISLVDSNGNMKSLMQVMEETRDAFQGLTEDEKAQYAAMLAGQNGMSGLLAVVNATEADMNKLSTAVDNADGSAKKMADTMQDNLNGQLTILKSGMEEAAISIGDALMPQIRGLAEGLQDAITWFNGLDDSTKNMVAQILVLTAAAGPVLSMAGSAVIKIGALVEGVGGLAAALTAGEGAALTFGAALGPLGVAIAALGIAFVATGAHVQEMPPEFDALQASMNETRTAIDAVKQANDSLAESMATNTQKIESTGTNLEYWREQLNNCFDSSGHLKEGMEQVAEYALGQLNAAMGSDYSSEFIRQGGDCTATLEEINGAIDANIQKLKEQALTQAFSAEYATALKNQADAAAALKSAETDVTAAMDEHTRAQVDLVAAQKQDNRGEGMNGAIAQASAIEREYAVALGETKTAYTEATKEAAKADATVAALEKTMDLMSHGKVDEAAEAYANAGVSAEEAGEKAVKAAEDSLAEWQELSKEKIQPPEIDQDAAAANAQETTSTMQGEFDSNHFTGYVEEVQGGDAAAQTAHGSMKGIVEEPMTGQINGVDGAESAARSAWNSMKSFFANNPITVAIKGVVTGGTGNRYSERAEGGFIRQQQVALIGEDGPEVIIPLSAGKRARAMDLFGQTAAILGVGARAYMPSVGTSSNTMNMGGININVYGHEGQDVHELAQEVADIVQRQVDSKSAMWG